MKNANDRCVDGPLNIQSNNQSVSRVVRTSIAKVQFSKSKKGLTEGQSIFIKPQVSIFIIITVELRSCMKLLL